jgi:hypothetical protein
VGADGPGPGLPDGCRLTPARTAPPAALAAQSGSGAGAGGGGSGSGAATGGGRAGAAGSGSAATGRFPVLRRVKLRPTRFRAAATGPALKPVARCRGGTACGRTGTRLTFDASAAGTLELRVRRVRAKHVTDVPGIVRQKVARGPTALRLLGRVGKRTLAPGSYRVIAQLVGRDGRRSRAATVRFTVVR